MEVYGKEGYIFCKNSEDMVILESGNKEPVMFEAPPLSKGVHDPFALLHKVVKEGQVLDKFDLSGLENNRIVMQILEAAKVSAKTGKTVIWTDYFK